LVGLLIDWLGFILFYWGKTAFVWFGWATFSTSNQVETVEKALAVFSIRRSYRVSTENGWKNVLLRNVNRINPNKLRLKRSIPKEHDLSQNPLF